MVPNQAVEPKPASSFRAKPRNPGLHQSHAPIITCRRSTIPVRYDGQHVPPSSIVKASHIRLTYHRGIRDSSAALGMTDRANCFVTQVLPGARCFCLTDHINNGSIIMKTIAAAAVAAVSYFWDSLSLPYSESELAMGHLIAAAN